MCTETSWLSRSDCYPLIELLIRLAFGWYLRTWISGGFQLPNWEEWLTMPKLFMQMIWFMLTTCFSSGSLGCGHMPMWPAPHKNLRCWVSNEIYWRITCPQTYLAVVSWLVLWDPSAISLKLVMSVLLGNVSLLRASQNLGGWCVVVHQRSWNQRVKMS